MCSDGIDTRYELKSFLRIRFPADLKSLVVRVANLRGETSSVFARRAILSELAGLGYLDDSQLKALGVRKVLTDNEKVGGDRP